MMEKKTAPLSQTQLGIYFECLRMDDKLAYNRHFLFTLDDSIDMDRLAGAIEKAVAAHPYMNATIGEVDGEPRQILEPLQGYHQEVLRMSEEEWQETLPKLLDKPLEFLGGRLFRFDLVETEKGKYFLRTAHHIAFDGTAYKALFHDIAEAYEGREVSAEGYDSMDFANDEAAARKQGGFDEAKTWYENTFSGLDVESLPIPDLEGNDLSFENYSYVCDLHYAEMRDFCKKHQISASALTCGVFGYLLGIYTAQQEMLFSTIYHGRKDERVKNIVGMYVKTLPVYCHWTSDTRVADYLKELTGQIADARKNDLYSFIDLNKICNMQEKPLFAYHGLIKTTSEFCGMPCLEEELDKNTTGGDLEVELMSVPNGLKIYIEYNSSKYSSEFIQTFAHCYENVLRQFMARESISEVEAIHEEQEKTLDSFNDTDVPYDETQTVVSLFHETVQKYPRNTALIFEDKKFTYAELDSRANDIAARIVRLGCGHGDVAALMLPRDEHMPMASLGILKAGCAYQPLDPTYPPERLNFMVKDADAKVLVTTKELRHLVGDYAGEILYIDEIPHTEDFSPECATSPDDLFVILYTSGSTGVPKGVKLTHGNLVCNIHWYWRYFGLQPEHRTALYAGFGFDMHMFDLYSSLTRGAAACMVPEDMRLDFPALNAYLEANGVTHMFITTQVGRQFAADVDNHSLHHLCVAGEKLVTVQPPKNFALHNGYGPSETTMLVTIFRVDALYKNIPIGKPLDNVKLYIVDVNGHRLPIGACGELWAAGPQVGAGYLNRPEKTAEVFIKNPFEGGKYENVYKTGDIVRYRRDGNLEFVGRRDGQVKIRGFRIELSEVEAVIREFPGIKDATVAAFDNPAGEKSVAAYIVSDAKIDIEEMNRFISERKPPYMVPAVTMQIEKIPLNPNGKVNRRVLPKPEIKRKSRQESAAPLNLLERELKGIAAEIIGTDNFGITDIFGEIGLTSISSIRLATKIYKKYNVQVQVRGLVKAGSIQSIENEILQKWMAADDAPEAKAEEHQKPSKKSCPLTFAQQGVYAECRANAESTLYNVPLAVKFPEGIQADELEHAVRNVVKAHSYLLCHFAVNEQNEIIQEPMPNAVLDIPRKEMTEQEFPAYRQQFVRPFDLDKGPLARFEIVQAESLYLLLDLHHLICDGASLDIFLRQLCSALDGEEVEKETYSYYDYAAEETLSSDAEEFFAGRMALSETATQLLPDIYGEDLSHREANVSTATDFAAVKKFALEKGVTPAAVYLAAAYIVLSRFVYEDVVTIATISNGRSNLRISNTMGMFVNTLPLVESIDSSEQVETFLKRAAKNFADTIAHENYPFASIAAKYDFRPSVSYTYQIGVLEEYQAKGGNVVTEVLALDRAKLPIGLYIVGTEENACIKVNYDEAMYSREMMEHLANCYETTLRGLMEKQTLAGISITNEQEWKTLDTYHRPWDLDFDKQDTAVSVFRRNAALWPDKVAAVYRDKEYTYRELDELTDRLAARIYKKMCSVTGKTSLAEEIVAILIPRNENVFILPLAVLKTGCAYEPLDPSYPSERLNYMVKDAGAGLLLADASLGNLVNEYEGETLTLEELYAAEDETVSLPAPAPEDLFVVLYTSGSTGMPKGCQLEHRNLVAYAHGVVPVGFYTKDDKIAAYASFGFDVNMSDVFCTLLNGGTVYLIPEEIRMNLDALADYFDQVGITALLLTTQVGVQFLKNYPHRKSLRMLVMGGEKLPPVDPAGLSYTIVNGYGPTENCCGVSLFPIEAWEQNIPIGRPMGTIHAYVLDKTGHRLPAGAAGEFCLSGPQVARGYLNRPEKTAEAFAACPFNEFRMYHTGDVVRYRQNGDVEFVGRKDGQVKIRGFRIETSEVEAVIRNFKGVRDVTVQAYDYENGGKYLAAFVTGDSKIDTQALSRFIKEQKPAYMVPAAYMQLDKIPLTVNQKVDKKALPKPSLQRTEYVAPVSREEEDFCEIFSRVLGLPKVGTEDDFFDIGGSSILAMQVVIAAGKKGYQVVYNDIFSHTTPKQLAAFVGGETAVEAAAPADTEQTITEIDADGYDYSAINALLAGNTMEAVVKEERQLLGDVLLAGATGYLGIHVLHELLASTTAKVHCLVRPKDGESGKQRLQSLMVHYFGSNFEEHFSTRISVLEGDATDPHALEGFAPSSPITVINCAASVKHFAKGNEIERTNVDSVKQLVHWCEAHSSRLVHISTGSVIGARKDGKPPVGCKFHEGVLYIGQDVGGNQYVHSKFLAERIIYEEMLKNGLNAKVLRVGNLAPRHRDGRFQVNYRTNNSMNTFKAYKTLGCVSYDLLDREIEFSPIDYLAKAVLALAETPKECVCFMPVNPHRALLQDVVEEISRNGFRIRPVPPEEMSKVLQEALADKQKRDAVLPLLAYAANGNTEGLGLKDADMRHTLRVLYRQGFRWPETGSAYIRQFIEKLNELSFFGEN